MRLIKKGGINFTSNDLHEPNIPADSRNSEDIQRPCYLSLLEVVGQDKALGPVSRCLIWIQLSAFWHSEDDYVVLSLLQSVDLVQL